MYLLKIFITPCTPFIKMDYNGPLLPLSHTFFMLFLSPAGSLLTSTSEQKIKTSLALLLTLQKNNETGDWLHSKNLKDGVQEFDLSLIACLFFLVFLSSCANRLQRVLLYLKSRHPLVEQESDDLTEKKKNMYCCDKSLNFKYFQVIVRIEVVLLEL